MDIMIIIRYKGFPEAQLSNNITRVCQPSKKPEPTDSADSKLNQSRDTSMDQLSLIVCVCGQHALELPNH